MIEKHEETIKKEGRVMASDRYIEGEIVAKSWSYMWVKPNNQNLIPAKVRPKLATMNKEARANFLQKPTHSKQAGGKFCDGITDNVVYVHLADVQDTFLES